MAIKSELLCLKLTGTARMLGSITSDKDVYTNYLIGKTKTDEELRQAREDIKNLPDDKAEEFVEKQTTCFYRDVEDGGLVLKAYQVKGFLKEAAKALKGQLQLAAHVSKIDNLVFITPTDIRLYDKNGNRIMQPDGILERPLRGETAQGPRVSLAKSEYINEGWTAEIRVRILDNEKTAKSKKLDADMLMTMFEYGEFKGLLQWRNAGNGSFTVERKA